MNLSVLVIILVLVIIYYFLDLGSTESFKDTHSLRMESIYPESNRSKYDHKIVYKPFFPYGYYIGKYPYYHYKFNRPVFIPYIDE